MILEVNSVDRTEFAKRMRTITTMSDAEINKVIVDSIDSNVDDKNPRGHRYLIIVMEELAELAQEVSKQLRGKGDKNALIEESADVLLGIRYIQEIVGITVDELNKAMSVKAERIANTQAKFGLYV